MSIVLDRLMKSYDEAPVVRDVSVRIETGEFFVLLGPSGSGKSTLLRMIAGLSEVDAGRIFLDDREVTAVAAKDRGIGFVFQNYALFRNMTVADNVEFALRVRKVTHAERRRRSADLLDMVGLGGFGGRYPWQLSGGQQQRVALARALAHEPPVLLLDEPFGALDAKIRVELRRTVRAIQRELGLTAVFVTHDQEEAFELSDRVAVLHHGRILEVGEPAELYLRPRSPFVATFLGAANLLVGEATVKGVRLGELELPLRSRGTDQDRPRRMQVLLRPEDTEVSVGANGAEAPVLGTGVVESRSLVGATERLRVRLPAPAGVRQIAPTPPYGGGEILIDITRPQHRVLALPLQPGDTVRVGIRRIHALAPGGLGLFVVAGDNPQSRAAQSFAASLAARTGARIEWAGPRPQDRSSAFGLAHAVEAPGASEPEGLDVAVLGVDGDPERVHVVEQFLASGLHVLAFAPDSPDALPANLLVCVAVGEPGKADIRLASRLAHQLDATATVLTVLPDDTGADPVPPHAQRFLEVGARSLAQSGSRAAVVVRRGDVEDEIVAQLREGRHDLLVVGAPVPAAGARSVPVGGIVARLLRRPLPCPVLIVRQDEEL